MSESFPNKQVSRADVAKLANVSLPTVSQVLNNTKGHRISEETQKRVREAADKLGYRPSAMARAIKSGFTGNVGIVLCNTYKLFDAYTAGVLQGVWNVLHSKKVRLLIEMLPEDGDVSIMFREKAVDAIVLVAPNDRVDQVKVMTDAKFPIIAIGNRTNEPCHFSDVDNVDASHQVVKKLAELGHEKIAYLCGPTHSMTSARDRLTGFKEAMQKNKLPVYDDMIVQTEYTFDSAKDAAKRLIESDKSFSVILGASDGITKGAMEALNEYKGSNRDYLSFASVALLEASHIAGVVQNLAQIGASAAELIIEHMRDPMDKPKTILTPGTWSDGISLQAKEQ